MNIIRTFFSLPKTLLFNFKVFDFTTAIKMPVILHYNVKVDEIYRGNIVLNTEEIRIGMIKIGYGMGSKGIFDGHKPQAGGGGYISCSQNSRIEFGGSAAFAGGVSIEAHNGGTLKFGNGFTCNSYCLFSSCKNISFGDDCALGWRVHVRDVDGHKIFKVDDSKGEQINLDRDVIIGNHVWIAAHTDILKGTVIPANCVVAYGSLLTGQKFDIENSIYGGNPPRKIKSGINWSR